MNDEWYSYDECLSTVRHRQFNIVDAPTVAMDSDINTLYPTTVVINQGGIHCEGGCRILSIPRTESIDETYLQWLHCTKESSSSISQLICDIKDGTARGVSDGSYQQNTRTGTAAWRLESGCGTEYIQGTSIVPGQPKI